MSVSEDRIQNLEKSIKHIGTKLDAVHDGFMTMQEHVKHMSAAVYKLSDVETKLTKVSTELTETRKDVDILFEKVRKVEDEGFAGCPGHIKETARLDKEIEGLKNKAWLVWLLFAAQIIQIVFLGAQK